MKLINILIFLIFNSILWSLINSVKNNKDQKEIIRSVGKASKNIVNKNSNDGGSVDPQIQKLNEMSKNAVEDTTGNNGRKENI